MRICVIGDGQSPHIRERANVFARLGHAVSFISPVKADGGDIDVLSSSSQRNGLLGEANFLRAYYRLIRDCPADLVHVHYAASLGAWLALLARPDTPLIVSTMGGDILDQEQMVLPRTARWMTRQVLKQADLVTTKTDHMMARLSRIGVATDKTVKNPWGIDLEEFQPPTHSDEATASTLGIEDHHRVILSPRMLRPFYNTDLVLRAMPSILQREPDARLVVLEHGADEMFRADLRRLADELGITDAVIWGGDIPHNRMSDVYSLADAVVSLSPSDGFPQTVVEALACGKPCVVSRLARYEEFIQDGESAVFTDLTTEDVAGALLSVLTDAEKAEQLRANGIEVARRIGDIRDNAGALLDEWRQRTASGVGVRRKGMGLQLARAGCVGI